MATEAQLLIGEVFDASALKPEADYTLDLPRWMRLSGPTDNRTSRISADAVARHTLPDTARAFSRNGTDWGLLLEPAAANLVDEQDLANWTDSGGSTVTAAVGTDGVSINCRVEDDAGLLIEGRLYTLTVATTQYAYSAWIFVEAPPSPTTGAQLYVDTGTEDVTAENVWTYVDGLETYAVTNPTWAVYPRGTTTGDSGFARFWGMQLELRAYPTSYIGGPGDSFPETRAADSLSVATSVLLIDGYLDTVIGYRPHYAHDEASGDHNLIYFSDQTRLYFDQSATTFVLEIGGATLTSAAVTFARHDEITLTVQHTADGRSLTVAGAATGNGTVSAAAVAAIEDVETAYILGGPSGCEEGADLRALVPNRSTYCDLADERILSQMDDVAGADNLRRLVCVFAAEPGRYRDLCQVIIDAFDVAVAEGDQLDLIGALVGLRREGFTDARYRVFLQIQIELMLGAARAEANWTGTSNNVLRIVRLHIGAGATAIRLRNASPYSYQVTTPGLVMGEAALLVRFLKIASYAGVIGNITIELGADSKWASDAVTVTGAGVWCSDAVTVAGCATWGTVRTTV